MNIYLLSLFLWQFEQSLCILNNIYPFSLVHYIVIRSYLLTSVSISAGIPLDIKMLQRIFNKPVLKRESCYFESRYFYPSSKLTTHAGEKIKEQYNNNLS